MTRVEFQSNWPKIEKGSELWIKVGRKPQIDGKDIRRSPDGKNVSIIQKKDSDVRVPRVQI